MCIYTCIHTLVTRSIIRSLIHAYINTLSYTHTYLLKAYEHARVRTCACIHIHTYIPVSFPRPYFQGIPKYIRIHIHTYIHTCLCNFLDFIFKHTKVYTYVCIHIHTYIPVSFLRPHFQAYPIEPSCTEHMYVRMYVCMHACMHHV